MGEEETQTNDNDGADEKVNVNAFEEEEEEAPMKAAKEVKETKAENAGGDGLGDSGRGLLRKKSAEVKTWRYTDGMLTVTVIKATNVDNLDEDEGPDGGSDPYVELELKGNYRKERTKIVYNNHEPVWNERFQLFVDDAREDVLKVKVYDH